MGYARLGVQTRKPRKSILYLLHSSVSSIEDIQIFGMNMPFISSSEAKSTYFMSGEA